MSEDEYDFFDWDIHDDEEKKCKHCQGKGYLSVEPNSSLAYQCPDCMEAES
tara:strand:+ start:1376 stop:1528 length:153 start_codon:yes stop_codon:yes gene_type:complete